MQSYSIIQMNGIICLLENSLSLVLFSLLLWHLITYFTLLHHTMDEQHLIHHHYKQLKQKDRVARKLQTKYLCRAKKKRNNYGNKVNKYP